MSTDTYPLKWPAGWPRANKYNRRWGSFSRNLTSDSAARGLLAELQRLGASNVVISSNLKPRQFSRVDDADPTDDPGVAVYFTYNGKQMSMAQDQFDRVSKNLRSLTLAIEAMRAIERHGGGFMMQRSFEGFAALPPPDGESAARPLRPWREVLDLGDMTGPNVAQLAGAEAVYRAKAKELHAGTGHADHEQMAELNIAIEHARQELRESAG